MISLSWALPAHAAPEIPFSLQLKYEEAQTYLDSGQWAEAIVALRALLRDAPRYSPGTIDLARALVNAGRREEALAALNEAVEFEREERREVLIRRSRTVARTFFTQESHRIYQEGLNELTARKYGSARARFDKALAREGDNAEILLRAGQAALLDGDFDSAAERLRLARQLSPYEPEVRLWLGRALHQKGELSLGIEELRGVAVQLEDHELAAVWLADALVAANQRLTATQGLERHVAKHPQHVQALFALARHRYFGAGGRETATALWAVRKELQVAMSRLPEYEKSVAWTELGLDLRDPSALRAEVQLLMSRVELRLQGDEKTNGT